MLLSLEKELKCSCEMGIRRDKSPELLGSGESRVIWNQGKSCNTGYGWVEFITIGEMK